MASKRYEPKKQDRYILKFNNMSTSELHFIIEEVKLNCNFYFLYSDDITPADNIDSTLVGRFALLTGDRELSARLLNRIGCDRIGKITSITIEWDVGMESK